MKEVASTSEVTAHPQLAEVKATSAGNGNMLARFKGALRSNLMSDLRAVCQLGRPIYARKLKLWDSQKNKRNFQTGIITARLGRQRLRFDHAFYALRPTDIGQEQNPFARTGVSVMSHERR